MRQGLLVALSIASLLLIGAGCYLAYPPAGLIVPGALVWIDLTLAGRRRTE